MDIHKIVLDAIEKAGADGLVNAECECGCGKEDLAPCGGLFPAECKLAKREPAPEESDYYPGEWFVEMPGPKDSQG